MNSAVDARPLALGQEKTARSAPGSRLGLWLGLGIVLASFLPRAWFGPFLVLYDLALLALFSWDRARLKRVSLRFTRSARVRLFAHQRRDYTLDVELLHGPALRLWLEESAPLGFTIEPRSQSGRVEPGLTAYFSAELHATRHGAARMSELSARRESALGLCAIVETHACISELTAYPRLALGNEAWPALLLNERGALRERRRAAARGGEVEGLRPYTTTDPMRSIDWKATAKRQQPIARSYQLEQSQTLWLVLDASRTMMSRSAPDRDETRFEAAIEAALFLAESALAQGDEVGLMVCGRSLRLSLDARRGRGQLFALVNALLKVHPEPSELDVAAMLASFKLRVKKRALFILFSDLDNEADLQELADHASMLTRRHLALCVSLDSGELSERLASPIDSERDAYDKLAAIHLETERERLKQNLRTCGIQVIESRRAELPRAALLEYQRQKRAGRL